MSLIQTKSPHFIPGFFGSTSYIIRNVNQECMLKVWIKMYRTDQTVSISGMCIKTSWPKIISKIWFDLITEEDQLYRSRYLAAAPDTFSYLLPISWSSHTFLFCHRVPQLSFPVSDQFWPLIIHIMLPICFLPHCQIIISSCWLKVHKS